MNNTNLHDNIDYSETWLIEQIIKEDFASKESKKEQYITMKKIDLYKFVLKFLKLNKKGE